MAEYLLPDVGEGLTEAEIVSWKVKVGDTIAVNDIVVEIETAKSLVELPSPYSGVVGALLVTEGATVPVGTPIIRIGDPSAAAVEVIDTNVPPEGEVTLVGYGPREAKVGRRRRRSGMEAAGVRIANADVQDAFTPGEAHQHEATEQIVTTLLADSQRQAESVEVAPPMAKPPVRKLAKDLGVDLAQVTGSGPHGSVTREDVHSAASAPTSTPVSSTEREWREPIKGVRKMMGQAMVASAFTAPHVTEWVSVDVSATMELIAGLRKRPEFRDIKLSPLAVLAKAACLAIRANPVVNSWWDQAAGEVVFKNYVNLGIAAATPRGLVVPNIKGAESMKLSELAAALGELAATARAGKTQPADMAGGTFTITNVGVFGIDGGTPIINPGESAILALGAVRRTPWVVGSGAQERIEIRDVATLSLSFDHRHVDGEAGSRFLADVAGMLANPGTALLF